MEILIRFIGIITLACFGNDPGGACEGSIPMKAYIPMSVHEVCGDDIHQHKAYIRITQPHTPSNWNAIPCEPKTAGICSLYALGGDELFIKEVSRGSGVLYPSANRPSAPSAISWKAYEPQLVLEDSVAETRSVAYMDLAAGTLNMQKRKRGMWVGHLTVKEKDQHDIVIESSVPNGVVTRSIKIHSSSKATIDLINLVEEQAKDHPIEKGGGTYQMGKEHFYLHYLLAKNVPQEDCSGPEPPPAPTPAPSVNLGADISCSNSNYP